MLIDRHILARFLGNFVILFALIFVLAVSIDVILALDKFIDAARASIEQGGGEPAGPAVFLELLRLGFNFQGPRVFQFYAYLHGIAAIGAMGFTLSRMYKAKEIVALLASGISMHRIAMPFVAGVFILSLGQLLNQEVFLPRVAPLLLRDHGDIGESGVEAFPVAFTADGDGDLLQAAQFAPRTETLELPTIIRRDDRGRTYERITAAAATWGEREVDGEVRRGWILDEGVSVRIGEGGPEASAAIERVDIDFHETDLSPRVLIVRRHSAYAAMLSLAQIRAVLDAPGILGQGDVVDTLARHQYSRFAGVVVNVLVMWLALPSFLLREPAKLLSRSVQCAAITMTSLIGAAIFILVDLPGIRPAVAVFLPSIVLLPIVIGRWVYLRT